MTKILNDAFDQQAFVASAAALAASHVMSDHVWKRYFPELPAQRPELRTVLINIHRQALINQPFNRMEAKRMIGESFNVSPNAADDWLNILQGESKKNPKKGEKRVAFIVEQQGDRRHEIHLVPSARAKKGLFEVGREYLACLRLVAVQLAEAMEYSDISVDDMTWLDEIKAILKLDVVDYKTRDETPIG